MCKHFLRKDWGRERCDLKVGTLARMLTGAAWVIGGALASASALAPAAADVPVALRQQPRVDRAEHVVELNAPGLGSFVRRDYALHIVGERATSTILSDGDRHLFHRSVDRQPGLRLSFYFFGAAFAAVESCGIELEAQNATLLDQVTIRLVNRLNRHCDVAKIGSGRIRFAPDLSAAPFAVLCAQGSCPDTAAFDAWLKGQREPGSPGVATGPTKREPEPRTATGPTKREPEPHPRTATGPQPPKPEPEPQTKRLDVTILFFDSAAGGKLVERTGRSKLVTDCSRHRSIAPIQMSGFGGKFPLNMGATDHVKACLVEERTTGVPACYEFTLLLLTATPHAVLDMAAIRQARECPKPPPQEVGLIDEHNRPIPAAELLEIEQGLGEKADFAFTSVSGNVLRITAQGNEDPRDLSLKARLQHHDVIGEAEGPGGRRTVQLRRLYAALTALKFQFKTSAGVVNHECVVDLVVSPELRLGAGWRSVKDANVPLHWLGQHYGVHVQANAGPLYLSMRSTAGLELSFTGPKCQSTLTQIAINEILGLSIVRETRPASLSLIALLSGDERMRNQVSDEQRQRLWEEVLRMITDVGLAGPRDNEAWERVAVFSRLSGRSLVAMVNPVSGNQRVLANESAILTEAERLTRVVAGVRPIEHNEIVDQLQDAHGRMGFNDSGRVPTLIVYVSGLIEDQRTRQQSVCSRGAVSIDPTHRVFVIELFTREGRSSALSPISSAPEGLYDCIGPGQVPVPGYVGLEVPKVLVQTARERVFQVVNARLKILARTFAASRDVSAR